MTGAAAAGLQEEAESGSQTRTDPAEVPRDWNLHMRHKIELTLLFPVGERPGREAGPCERSQKKCYFIFILASKMRNMTLIQL